jgi:hypothetical protein
VRKEIVMARDNPAPQAAARSGRWRWLLSVCFVLLGVAVLTTPPFLGRIVAQDQVTQTLCGGVQIDPYTQGCCNDQTYDLSSQGCCGTTVYSLHSQGCCGGLTYYLASQACCDGTLYDPSTCCCCDDTVETCLD